MSEGQEHVASTEKRWRSLETGLNIALVVLLVAILAVGGLFGYQVYADKQRRELANASTRVIKALEKQIRQNPNDSMLRVRLGEAFGAAGKYPQAIEQLNVALKITPEHTGAYLDLGVIAMMTDKPDKAVSYFEKVLEITAKQEYSAVNQRRELAFYNLGLIALDDKRFEDAAGYFKEALRIRKDASDTYYYLAEAFRGMGEDEAALKNLEIAVTFDPGFAEAHYLMGQLYMEAGDKVNASARLYRAAELAPKADPPQEALASLGDPEEYAEKARQSFSAKDYENAITNVLIAGNLAPKDIAIKKLHAQIALAKGNKKAAFDIYKAVLKLDADDAEAKKAVTTLRKQLKKKT